MLNKTMPCAGCKLLRRRCTSQCIFLPYFPPDELDKFAALHRIFGASNVSKMLQEVPSDSREDAVKSMVYEAKARLRDPVYGSVGLVACLQSQVLQLHAELDTALVEAMTLRNQLSQLSSTVTTTYQPCLEMEAPQCPYQMPFGFLSPVYHDNESSSQL